MYHFKRQAAFTLIELLIVMLLLSISIGIVIPLSVQQVESSKLRAERAKVVMIIEHLQSESFFKAKEIQVTVINHVLTVGDGDDKKEVKLNFIKFQEAKFLLTPLRSAPIELNARYADTQWVLVVGNEQPFWQRSHD